MDVEIVEANIYLICFSKRQVGDGEMENEKVTVRYKSESK